MTVAPVENLPALYRSLRDQASAAFAAGRLEEALALFDEALACARAHGDERLCDRALCNRAALSIELGDGRAHLPELRQILLRGSDDDNCFLAAYHLARAHELAKDHRKGLFYARVARDRAVALADGDRLATSHNLLGDLLLAESWCAEATREYEQALALIAPEASTWRAQILDNLGYCRVLQGRPREGFRLLYESLRVLRRQGGPRPLTSVHLDLCYAHLEAGRLRHARRHAERALALARETGQRDALKNALYLAGEAARLSNDAVLARRHFGDLQRLVPDTRGVADVLMAVDVRRLINLKA